MRQTVYFLIVLSLAGPAVAEREALRPLDCSHLMSWSIGGIATPRLERLARDRSLAFIFTAHETAALLQSGVDPKLVQSLRLMKGPPSGVQRSFCRTQLTMVGKLVRAKEYEQAEPIMQKLIASDPNNSALRFALGYIQQQQNDWDAAFDAYLDSRNLMPGLSDTHARLAYVFYRYDDGDNAIAEARTALSIDPKNSEAYRYK